MIPAWSHLIVKSATIGMVPSGLTVDVGPGRSLSPLARDTSPRSRYGIPSMALFESSVTIACPLEKAWDFLVRPANLKLITPPDVGLHLVEAPEVLALRSKLLFKVQGWGQVQQFLHEITAFEEHKQLSEKMIKGVFGRWVHDHLLATNGNGETVVTDRIEFEPPTGLLGFLVTNKRIQEYLEDGFDHRQVQLKKLLGSG
jgi:ligand-binding SRPBCC domain-containing protein